MSLNNFKIDINLSGVLSKTANPLAEVQAALALNKRLALPDGTTAGKADRIYVGERTINASSNDDLDLAAGLTDVFGAAITFAKVKAIVLVADDANTNDLLLKPGATNAFTGPFGAGTHTVQVGPGGAIVLAAPKAGWTVTADTGDTLRVTNTAGGTAVKYRLAIVGTSA